MKPSGGQLRTIANYIEAGEIKPVIDRVFPFEDAQKQWNIPNGRAKGKIIVKLNNNKTSIFLKWRF